MKRVLKTVILAAALSATAGEAQVLVDNGIDDRVEALNALFESRRDLVGDTTFIAACSLPSNEAGLIPGLDPGLTGRFISGDTALAAPLRCTPQAFAGSKKRVLWVQSLRIERDSSAAFQPEFRRRHVYVTLQVLESPSYREHQEYHIQPRGIQQSQSGQGTELASWRVVEYKLLGWDFHWGDNVGHGSRIRREPAEQQPPHE